MSSEEMRDVGPYEDVQQVLDQFANWGRGLTPTVSDKELAVMLVMEAAMVSGVRLSEMEQQHVRRLDPVTATIVHGWLLRAHMAGRKAQHEQTVKEIHVAIDTAMRGSGYEPPASSRPGER